MKKEKHPVYRLILCLLFLLLALGVVLLVFGLLTGAGWGMGFSMQPAQYI
jgi:hypothetical protein